MAADMAPAASVASPPSPRFRSIAETSLIWFSILCLTRGKMRLVSSTISWPCVPRTHHQLSERGSMRPLVPEALERRAGAL